MTTNPPSTATLLDNPQMRTFHEVLGHTPAGRALVALLQSQKLWVDPTVVDGDAKALPRRFGDMTPSQLSDWNFYTQSELSRLTRMLGVLEGQMVLFKRKTKRERSKVANRIAAEKREDGEKEPTAARLNQLVDVDPEISRLEDTAALIESVVVTLRELKEAAEGECRVVSREISAQGDQLRFGMTR